MPKPTPTRGAPSVQLIIVPSVCGFDHILPCSPRTELTSLNVHTRLQTAITGTAGVLWSRSADPEMTVGNVLAVFCSYHCLSTSTSELQDENSTRVVSDRKLWQVSRA